MTLKVAVPMFSVLQLLNEVKREVEKKKPPRPVLSLQLKLNIREFVPPSSLELRRQFLQQESTLLTSKNQWNISYKAARLTGTLVCALNI